MSSMIKCYSCDSYDVIILGYNSCPFPNKSNKLIIYSYEMYHTAMTFMHLEMCK